jgi:hypothetical protein
MSESTWGDSWDFDFDGVVVIPAPKQIIIQAQEVSVRQILAIPTTKGIVVSGAAGVQVLSGALVVLPSTKAIVVAPQQLSLSYALYKRYLVFPSSPFNYSFEGVELSSVEGYGTAQILVDGAPLGSPLGFDTEKTNNELSGIINKGQRLEMGLIIENNGALTSFNANFALKRT